MSTDTPHTVAGSRSPCSADSADSWFSWVGRVVVQRVAALGAPVTGAILPYAKSAAQVDGLLRAAGHETIVHLPLEPRGVADPGPGAIARWMSEDETRARTRAAFASVPGAIGFNNHMGSGMTSCATCLEPILAVAGERALIALDSRTVAHSQLAPMARAAGLATLHRDVFLDNERTESAIWARVREAEATAQTKGWVVVIGHPYAETLTVLEDWIAEGEGRAVRIEPLSQAARLIGGRERA